MKSEPVTSLGMHTPWFSQWRDYLALCKPRVVMLMVLTAWVGMCLATPGWVPWRAFVFGSLGITLSAAAAAAINHLVDQRIDSIMGRTRHRPLPMGKLNPRQVLGFAMLLGTLSMLLLSIEVNALTAVLTLLTLVGYAGVYSLYLKRATPQNIVIGGAAGAAPPLLGWTAVTGSLDPHSLLLVLIIFVWTPPHFWALAIQRYKEYARADIPMLPVTHGIKFTKQCVVLYTWLLLAVSLLPYVMSMSGIIYAVAAIVAGGVFLLKAYQLYFAQDDHIIAGQVFRYSIWYLMILFIFLLLDHYFLFL